MFIDTLDIELGDRVRDRVTGYEGVAVCVAQWYAGCARVTVQPAMKEDGKVPEYATFDVLQLDVVDKAAATLRGTAYMSTASVSSPVTGGPRPEPARD